MPLRRVGGGPASDASLKARTAWAPPARDAASAGRLLPCRLGGDLRAPGDWAALPRFALLKAPMAIDGGVLTDEEPPSRRGGVEDRGAAPDEELRCFRFPRRPWSGICAAGLSRCRVPRPACSSRGRPDEDAQGAREPPLTHAQGAREPPLILLRHRSESRSLPLIMPEVLSEHPLRLRLDLFWGGGAEGLSPVFGRARATLHWWIGLELQQVAGF